MGTLASTTQMSAANARTCAPTRSRACVCSDVFASPHPLSLSLSPYPHPPPQLELLKMDPTFLNRNVNQGFSGGERKRNEILQMAVLEVRGCKRRALGGFSAVGGRGGRMGRAVGSVCTSIAGIHRGRG